jgi:hypothetical protein
MNNKKELKGTNLPIPAKYFDVFEWKLLGLTYKQIAERTSYSLIHIKHLFMKGGVLYEYWRDYAENKKSEVIEEMLDMAFTHGPDAMRAHILDAKLTNSPIGIAARKILFEYTLGRPEERLKLDAKVGVYTFADWIKAETLKDKENERANRYKTDKESNISSKLILSKEY